MISSKEDRLARFEAFAEAVSDDRQATQSRMESLRNQGKMRTATYQQLLANKMTLDQIIARLSDAGIDLK